MLRRKSFDPTSINSTGTFAEALRRMGLVLEGAPVMDGHIHRVPVEGDKRGQKSGAYVGHLDGIKLIEQIPYVEHDETFADYRKNGGREIFLRLPDVIKQVGLKRSTIYKKIQRQEFPAPIKIGERSSVWPESEIKAWIADHKAMN